MGRMVPSNRRARLVMLTVVLQATFVGMCLWGSIYGSAMSPWDTNEIVLAQSSPRIAVDEAFFVNRYPICSEALQYFDEAELKSAVRKAAEFHTLGGSLKSVQLFRDAAIDDTLHKLSLTFVPNDADGVDKKKHKNFTGYLKQYYDANYDPRGGYGRPLPGKFDHEQHKALHENRWMDTLEPTKGRQRWDAALGPVGPNCAEQTQLGPPGRDGSKAFCARRQQGNETAPVGDADGCHILSVGGNDNWVFESAVRESLQHCTTHTFDCTLPGGKPSRKPDDENVLFYNACMDAKSYKDAHGRHYMSYSDMLLAMQDTRTAGMLSAPKIFKLDVEGFEYDIFSQMVSASTASPGHTLLPQQIGVELHWGTRMTGLDWMPRMRSSAEIALLSNMMFQAGYLLVKTDFNPYCTSCMEVIYFKAICHSLH